jgi:hypothetical protein
MSRLYLISLIILSTVSIWFMGYFKLLAVITLGTIIYLFVLVEKLTLRVKKLEGISLSK